MLPDELAASRRRSRGLAGACRATQLARSLALLLAACSTLPEHHQPAHADHDFDASFAVGEDGRLLFPITTRNLVVRQIELQPKPLGEQFLAEQRWFLYPAGTRVRAQGQLRAYQNESGTIPLLRELLPHAKLRGIDGAQSTH